MKPQTIRIHPARGKSTDPIGVIEPPLTKRERFAMAAMQGLCANREWFQWDFAQVAQMARIQADDQIAELKANPEPE
jgi:hypothetical protein